MIIEIDVPDNYLTVDSMEVRRKKKYDIPGVYVFYSKDDTPLYVGKTVSFKRRFNGHAASSEFYPLASYARLYEVKREYDKDIFETYLINELRPEYNRAKTFYARREYEDMLDDIIESIEEKLQEIRDLRPKKVKSFYEEDDDDFEALGEMLSGSERIAELEHEIRTLNKRKATLMHRMTA